MSALYYPRKSRTGKYRPIAEARATAKLQRHGTNFELTEAEIKANARNAVTEEIEPLVWDNPNEEQNFTAKCKDIADKWKAKGRWKKGGS